MRLSLYLHGSCAAGTTRAGSDVDLFVLAPTRQVSEQQLSRLLDVRRVQRFLVPGRPLDLVVVDFPQLVINHLIANSLHHARRMAGPAVEIPAVDPTTWADQAEWFAGQLVAGNRCRKAVLWAANARLVRAGAPLPSGKEDAARRWAEQVGGRWVSLLDRATGGRHLSLGECRAFMADAHAVAASPPNVGARA